MIGVNKPPSARLGTLDSLRGFAAFGVVLWHYRTGFGTMPFETAFRPFYVSGGYAVPFFFLLSGYVLSHVYWQEDRSLTLRRNITTRFARLAPLHYLTLVIVAVFQVWFMSTNGKNFIYQENDWYHFLLNVLFLQESGLQTTYSFNGPSWSISVELIVNVVFLAIVARLRSPLLAITAVFGLGLIALVGTPGDILYSNAQPMIDRLLLVGIVTFFGGALLYRIAPPSESRHTLFDVVFVCLVICTAIAMVKRPELPAFRLDLVITLILVPGLIVSAQKGLVANRLLNWSPLRWLGWISFSLYLTHFLVQCGFEVARSELKFEYSDTRVFIAFILASVAVGAITAKFIEWPIYRSLTGHSLRGDITQNTNAHASAIPAKNS